MSTVSDQVMEELGWDYKFPPTLGEGVRFTQVHPCSKKTVKLTTVLHAERCKKTGARVCELDITNLLFSAGASHHYVKLKLGHVGTAYLNGKQYGFVVSQDYANPLPFGSRSVEFEVTRRADRRDVDHDKIACEMSIMGPRTSRMKKGDWTHGWWSEEEARAGGIAFFKKHFAPGWVLLPVDYPDEGPRVELART